MHVTKYFITVVKRYLEDVKEFVVHSTMTLNGTFRVRME
jgi:hypothetical protein